MKRSFIIVTLSTLIISGALFYKSFLTYKNSYLINLISENLEALTNGDIFYLYHVGSGTCGMKYYDVNQALIIICGISSWEKDYYIFHGANVINWCCDSCESSTYCAGHM